VGKSSLIHQFICASDSQHIIGQELSFKHLKIKRQKLVVTFIDAGNSWDDVTPDEFYVNFTDIKFAVIVYDVISLESFRSVEKYIVEIGSLIENPPIILLVENKIDIPSKYSEFYLNAGNE
jgi:GTPase SAR1 family protein